MNGRVASVNSVEFGRLSSLRQQTPRDFRMYPPEALGIIRECRLKRPGHCGTLTGKAAKVPASSWED
jgi:hypothetical protein